MKYITTVLLGPSKQEQHEDKDLESAERRIDGLLQIHGRLLTEVSHVGREPETDNIHIVVDASKVPRIQP